MRLLIITQKVDKNDAVLGFVHGWISEFTRSFEHLTVICLEKGVADLPKDVTVYSLGKETGRSRIKYLWKFLIYIWRLRKVYDSVFVHMNPEYVILGTLFWRLWGKKTVLWYNHTFGTWKTRLAMKMADVVCHTSPYAFTAGTKKSLRMPAGIDTRIFTPDSSVVRIPRSILYLGRIAPVKNVRVLVEAGRILAEKGIEFTLDIYGGALPRDREYEQRLKKEVKGEVFKNKVRFFGPVPHWETVNVFRTREIFVNLTPSGNYDKTVLEAMACATIPVVSSRAFDDILSEEFRFEEGNAEDLVRVLERNLARSPVERQKLGEKFSAYVRENHDLQLLSKRITDLYSSLSRTVLDREGPSLTGGNLKKIYYVAHCRFPSERAHAIQMAKMIEAMRLLGADVELIVPRRRNTITKTAKAFYGLKTDIPVHYVPVLNLYSFGQFGYLLSGLSFIISYMLFITGRKISGGNFSLYTIDHDQFSHIGVSFLGVPYVFEVHDAKKFGWIFNRMFTKAKVILTINEIIKRELAENFKLSPEKILVHPNGIDIELFSEPVDRVVWRKKWNIALDKPLVLYVGKCYDWKGLEIFDDAFKALPDINFAFVGCTKEEVEKVTGKRCDFPNAFFFGQQSYTDMPKWMKSADILLVIGTKKNEYSFKHTSPMKMFEYMPTGVPILAAGTLAIRDMVSEKEVFFYEPDDSQSFIAQIREILRDKPHAEQVTSVAKLSAQKFIWANRVRLVFSKLT